MKVIKILFGILTIFTISFCNKSESKISMQQEAQNTISSSAAVVDIKDTLHKFVRTADLKFKVKSVIKSTYDIENIARNQGGFVTISNLTNTINSRNTSAYSNDSLLETINYSVTNDITIRIPNTKMDTTLKEIARNIDFLDFRIIKAEDVALSILANKLTQNRASKNEERVTNAIDNKGKKLDETTNAEGYVSNNQAEADNAKVANLSLKEQLDFSTIKIAMYQNPSIKHEVVVNDNQRPSFGERLGESFVKGWTILSELVLFVVQLWSLALFAGCAYLLARYFNLGNKLKKIKCINTLLSINYRI